MIIQQIDSLGRYVAMGTGTVLCREGDEPIRLGEVKDKGIPKISFTLTTGAKRNEDGHMSYQNVICAVYGNNWNASMFEYASLLSRNERVFFAGPILKKQGKDESGADITYSEVMLEFLVSVNAFYDAMLGGAVPKPRIKGSSGEDDGYSF